MARSKKGEEKAKEGTTIQIDVESFVRTRDAVVTSLVTLQGAITQLQNDYISQTNKWLGDHAGNAGLDLVASLSKFNDQPLGLPKAGSPAAGAEGDKKERKKRQHDPNAPKRPLTPFFLYMQTARPIIAADLGPEAAKGAASTEGTRRWKEMDDYNKGLWTDAYHANLRLYNARMHAYKVGGDITAKDMDDSTADAYAEEHKITATSNNSTSNTADAQLAGEAAAVEAEIEPEAEVDAEAEEEPEPEKEPTPPPKAKSKAARKPKGKAAASESSVPVPTPATPATITPKEKETAKKDTPVTGSKRKRASKKADEPPAEPEQLAVETPKAAAKPRKKKAKGDA